MPLVAQMVKNSPAIHETWVSSVGWEDPTEKGTTEDEVVGWHHQLNGHEFAQALGVGDGQGSLVCCSPWGHKELDMTEQLNQTELKLEKYWFKSFLG